MAPGKSNAFSRAENRSAQRLDLPVGFKPRTLLLLTQQQAESVLLILCYSLVPGLAISLIRNEYLLYSSGISLVIMKLVTEAFESLKLEHRQNSADIPTFSLAMLEGLMCI